MSNNSSTLKKAVISTFGVIFTILSILLLVYLFVLVHDKYIVSGYTDNPKYSLDNNWGGLKVNISIDEWDKVPSIPERTLECNPNSPLNDPKYSISGQSNNLCRFNNENSKYEYEDKLPEIPGYLSVHGKINLKNSFWNKDKMVPNPLILMQCANGKFYQPEIDGYNTEQNINARNKISAKFKFKETECATGKAVLVLSDGDRQAEIK